ncbi:MAG: glycoside hydrolase, family 13-like protein [Gemmatimonadetes bacterium]|nr:glycoside hydrolase, family 13-like protein [Gemmatimonadota bacterium]
MRFSHVLAAVSFAASSLALVPPALTQVVRGNVALSGGIATDQRGVRSSAVTLAPSVLLAPDPRFIAGLALSGTQFGSDVRAVGGTASLGARLPLGSIFALGASASGAMTQTSFNATYSSADLTPTLEATVSALTLYAGAHVARGSTSQQLPVRTPGGVFGTPVGATRDTVVSRSSAGPVFGGVLRISGARADQSGSVGYREEHARLPGVVVTDRVATGSLASGSMSFAVSAGLRDAPDEKIGYGSASATIAVGSMLSLQGAAGTYPMSRITGTLGGRFASIGVVLQGTRRIESSDRAPQVRGAPPVSTGMTRLAISAPSAARVEVAGDWNGWTPSPARRSPDGIWYADVKLRQGEYRYAFKIDGQRWRVPEGIASLDDGFGGRSALVTVR